jgi:hypothetical protein
LFSRREWALFAALLAASAVAAWGLQQGWLTL